MSLGMILALSVSALLTFWSGGNAVAKTHRYLRRTSGVVGRSFIHFLGYLFTAASLSITFALLNLIGIAVYDPGVALGIALEKSRPSGPQVIAFAALLYSTYWQLGMILWDPGTTPATGEQSPCNAP